MSTLGGVIVVEPAGGMPVTGFRIERGVGGVGFVDQQTERRVVVHGRQGHAIGLARVGLRTVEPIGRRASGQFAGSRIDADLRQRDVAGDFARELLVRLKEPPAVGDRQHRLALLAHATEVGDQVVQRVDRGLLPAPFDHLVGDASVVGGGAVRTLDRRLPRIAHLVLLFLRIDRIEPLTLAPVPVAGQEAVDGRRLAREGDVARGHIRGHDRDEIVRPNQAIERVDERLANPG
jgi:hypothetical protein